MLSLSSSFQLTSILFFKICTIVMRTQKHTFMLSYDKDAKKKHEQK